MKDAPGRSSNDRISVVLYGGNDSVKGALQHSTKHFAHNIHDVSYTEMRDNDVDPNTSLVGIYAEGRHLGDFEIGNNTSQKVIARGVYKKMMEAFNLHIAPYLPAVSEKEEPEKQDTK